MNMFKRSAMLTVAITLILFCSAQISVADALDDHIADLGAHGQPWYDIAESSGDWADALTALSSGGTLLISGATAISEDITVPANVHVKWLSGCLVTVNSTHTLTIVSPIEAGNYQLFVNGSDVIIEAAFDNKVPVTWFGGTDLQAFQQAHSATIDDAIFVHFPKGSYDFSGGSFKTYTDCLPIYISGDGMDNTTISDIGIINGTGIIEINNIGFDNCATVLLTSGNVTKLDINHVKFNNCAIGIKSLQVLTDFLDNIKISNCLFTATSIMSTNIRNICFRAGGISNVIIKNNVFKDLLTTSGNVSCIDLGDEDAAAEDTYNILINNNVIENIGNTARSVISYGAFCHGGYQIHMTDNIIKNCYWTDALYIKGDNSVVANNSVKDVEAGGITFKGIDSNSPKHNAISGNSIIGVCDYKPGLRVIGIASVTGNVVEIEMDENGTTSGGFPFECKTSTVIPGDLTITGNIFKGPKGVFILSPESTIFSDNLVTSDSFGLYVSNPISGGNYENLMVSGNVFNVKEYGVKCFGYHKNTVFENNVINLEDCGTVSESYFTVNRTLTISNNIFNIISGSGTATNYLFGYICNADNSIIKIDGNVINTSLPFSGYALSCDGGDGVSVLISNNIIKNQSSSVFTKGSILLRKTPNFLSVCNNSFEGEQGRIVALEPSAGISQSWNNIIINNNKIFGLTNLLYASSSATISTLSIRDNILYDNVYSIKGSQTVNAESIANNIELVP